MIAEQAHIIKTQILDLQLPSKHNAFEAQTAFRELFMQKLLPILSDYFDSVIPENITLRADRLEVDLGEVDFSKMDDYTVNIIAEKMKASLSKQLPKGDLPVGKTLIPTAWRSISLLLFFLQNGHLPWWQKELDFGQFESELLVILKSIPTAVRIQLKAFLKQASSTTKEEKVVVKRLVFQCSDLLIDSLLKAVYELKDSSIPLGQLTDRQEYWQARIKALVVAEEEKNEEKPAVQSIEKPQSKPKEQARQQPQDDQQSKETIMTGASDTAKVTEETRSISAEQKTPHLTNGSAEPDDSAIAIPGQDKNTGRSAQIDKSISDEVVIFKEQKTSGADGYYIHNSGLVLIAPYLSHFFTEVKLLKDQLFINEEAKIRAMHLLQYLVNFEEEAPEYELILNKILCGISLEKPVLKSVKLTEHEKQEARQLLEAVIRNWSALKSTSPEGLQEGFLRREGKLIQKKASGNWLLQVEGKAHDILLGQLPWTYSMIKQSWMPTMLTVEWL